MKSINQENCSNTSNYSDWLGFSLSPQMKMEAHVSGDPHFHTPASAVASSYYLPSFGHGEHGDFHSSLPIMPLKSDGSLCILEGVVPSSSPKLEDFLGVATMADHEYPFLSLDSMVYNQHHYLSGELQIPPMSVDETCMETWIDSQHALEQPVSNTNNSNISMVEDRGSTGCGDLQPLSLSMSPGSRSSCVNEKTECVAMASKKRGTGIVARKQTVHRKSIDTFGQRTSQYRGVTRHRWTGRYEAHLWDNSCMKEGQTRKGRQVYLGGYDMEDKAARAYDLAALKYWGPSTHTNFTLENYHQELETMSNMSRQEFVASLRRKSSGFSRGASMYRGVTRHHQHGRWQARIGRVAGNKDLYLGTFSTQEEAAEAYDIAAIKFRGVNAVTNFDLSRYDVEKIITSNTLPTGDVARRIRNEQQHPNEGTLIGFAPGNQSCSHIANADNSASEWKLVVHDHENVSMDPLKGNYLSPPFSMALHDLIGISSIHREVDEPNSHNAAAHFSNASSMVTSLNSSREASPERYIHNLRPDAVETKLISSTSNATWIPTAQIPMFAAWNDV